MPGGASVADSRSIVGLVGPAIVVSAFPLVQPHLYDAQIPPVVDLSGVLMFVAGLVMTWKAYRRSAP